MNKRMLYIKGNFKNFICYIGISLLALIIIISSTIIYNNNVISSADGATTSLNRFYLEEIAKRNVHEITTALDNNIKYSKRAINEIKESDLESKESLNSYLAMIEKLYDLDFFAVYDNEGEIYTLNNTILNVSNEYYLKKINDNLKLYITQTSESRALVLIVSKMDELLFQNKKLVSYISGIDIENIVSSLVSYNDKNKVICSLFNSSDGTCIVETEGSIEEGKSLFQLMDDAFFADEFTKEEFLNDWNNFNEGYTYYKGPLGYTYLYYMPVPNTNWMFTIRLRESVINEQITDYNKNMLISTQIQLSIVLACMAILFILAIIQTFKIQKEIYNRKSEKELFDQKTLAHLEQLKLKEKLLEEEKKNNRQASILQILSNEYSSVFYVDIIDDIAIPIRLSEFSVFKTGLEINKTIHDFGVTISWEQKGGNIRNHPLLKMLEKRIHFSETKLGLEPSPDIWETYFIPYVGNSRKEVQNYILDQTWYKPRDIIRLFTVIQRINGNKNIIDQECFDTSRKPYAEESWTEFEEFLTVKYSDKEVEGIKKSLTGIQLPFSVSDFQHHLNNKKGFFEGKR